MRISAKESGFTLIEALIVVVIIGLLAAMAIPNYTEYITRTKRSEGHALLIESATQQERFYAQNSRYVTNTNDIKLLALRNTKANNTVASDNGYYQLTIGTTPGDGGYTLTASQSFGDGMCGNLTLTALGTKGRTGSEKTVEQCWK